MTISWTHDTTVVDKYRLIFVNLILYTLLLYRFVFYYSAGKHRFAGKVEYCWLTSEYRFVTRFGPSPIINVPSGQFSNTWCAMSPAESLGLNRNSFVLPLTRMRRRFICKQRNVAVNTSVNFFNKRCSWYYSEVNCSLTLFNSFTTYDNVRDNWNNYIDNNDLWSIPVRILGKTNGQVLKKCQIWKFTKYATIQFHMDKPLKNRYKSHI